MEYILLLLRLILYMIPMGLFSLFIGVLGMEIYIRRKVRGGTLMVFWNPNREMVSQLVKTAGSNTVEVKEKTYTLIAEKQYSTGYPAWAPPWLQEKVPVYYFKPDAYECIDPVATNGSKPLMTASMLRDITDESMLKATIREAREAAEGGLQTNRNMPLYILIGVGIGAVLGGINLYIGIKALSMLEQLTQAVIGSP